MKVLLNSIDKVKSFSAICSAFSEDIDLISERYVIDAKSIMGILSLDLSKPIECIFRSDDNIDEEKFTKAVDCFILK